MSAAPEPATAAPAAPEGLTGLRVVVVGLGPMGRGIARLFAAAGAETTVVDADEETTVAGAGTLVAEAERDGQPAPVRAEPDLAAAVAGADLCLEAIVEDPAAKQALLRRLAGAAPPGMLVASNTSSLSIGELGRAFGDPARVVGMHFFNPPGKMRLVEVVRAGQTGEAAVQRALAVSRGLGKVPVVCTDSPNFVVNRVCRPLYYEAQLLVTQQVAPAVVDAVARGALGHRMGPLELLDFVGLHTHLASSRTAHRELGDPRYRPIPVAQALVRAGSTGRAAGRGFYDYPVETPAQARDGVTRPAPEPAGRALRLAGPGAAARRADPVVAAVADDRALVVLYCAAAAADPAEVAAVRRWQADGYPVVVDSSHGGWLAALPPGAGWLRLHTTGPAPFAEVVEDPLAGIAPTPAVAAVLAATGAASVPVPALPGLVADRLAHCLINEAALVVEEGTADRSAVDTALRLGMNHPAGPFAVLDRTGAPVVCQSLRGMQELFGDPRYRPAPLLLRQAAGQVRAASGVGPAGAGAASAVEAAGAGGA